jgi:hypothetical protein
MSDSDKKLICNSIAEFLIFAGQAGEPRPAHDDAPTSESHA